MTASDRFFEGRKPAAGLKHAILNRYLPKFVTMTGSQSAGRAFWIDAYAGPGEYEDGTLGSPALVVELADALKETVQLDCCFIEKNRTHASTLRQVLRGSGCNWPVLVGSAEKQLQKAVDMADELPLLTFLDPFGVTVPAEVLEETLLTRPQPGPWRSDQKKTEVILHYSDQAVRRMAGVLDAAPRSDRAKKAKVSTIATLDEFLGGQWWQDIRREQADDWEAVIRDRYLTEIAGLGRGWGYFPVPVRNAPDGVPLYHLVLLTRSPHGIYWFNEAVSKSRDDWIEAMGVPDDGQYSLFDEPVEFDRPQRYARDRIDSAVADNLRRLLQTHGAFSPWDHLPEVFGELAGVAREMHLRSGWKQLAEEGLVQPPATRGKKLPQQTITPT